VLGLAVLGVWVLGGCEPKSAFEHVSQYQTRPSGVVLHADGETAHLGLNGTNCTFELEGRDDRQPVCDQVDPPGDDHIEDIGPSFLADESVLLVADGSVWLVDDARRNAEWSIDAPGVVSGRLSSAGMVLLVDDAAGCELTFLDETGGVERAVSLTECPSNEGFDADPVTGRALVAAEGPVALILRDGTRFEAEVTGDLVAWDAGAELIYVATAGGDELVAIDVNLSVRWSVPIDGPIVAFSPAGGEGGVFVVVGDESWGGLELRSGADGAEIEDYNLPSAPLGLVTTADGSAMAMWLPDVVHFFRVKGH
jgi:hypothetical protein